MILLSESWQVQSRTFDGFWMSCAVAPDVHGLPGSLSGPGGLARPNLCGRPESWLGGVDLSSTLDNDNHICATYYEINIQIVQSKMKSTKI